MPSDPAAVPPPEWAVEKADEWLRRSDEDPLLTLARLLASVREGALREAAEACGDKRIVVTFGQPLPEYEPIPFNTACSECEDAILSLLHAPPSGGA